MNLFDERPVMTLLNETISECWDKTALADYGTDRRYTFGELYQNALFVQKVLQEHGIAKGDKVAICDKNCAAWAMVYLGALSYGCVLVPLLPEFKKEQIENLVEHSETKLMFSSMYPSINGQKCINTRTMFDVSSDEKPKVSKDNVCLKDGEPEDLAVISYTSGSTGNPKGVMLPLRSLWSNVWYGRSVYPELTQEKNFMNMLPLAHMFGQTFEFLYPISVGCTLTHIGKVPSPKVILKAFADVHPYIVITVPLIIEKIIRKKVFPTLQKPTMKVLLKIPGVREMIYRKIRKQLEEAFGGQFYDVVFGGAGASRDIEDFLIDKLHFRFTSGYGMTECGPLISYSHYDDHPHYSCGRPCDRMEVKILSDDPEKKEGEIVCRGMNLMLGYYKNPEATAEVIDEDGWFHTGDLGTMDKEGHVFIRGRKKNMLLSTNGQNIYPEEIESVITKYTNIDECIVVQRQHKLVALVYAPDEEPESVTAHLPEINHELPKYAQISKFEFMKEEFQKTPKRNIKRFLYK